MLVYLLLVFIVYLTLKKKREKERKKKTELMHHAALDLNSFPYIFICKRTQIKKMVFYAPWLAQFSPPSDDLNRRHLTWSKSDQKTWKSKAVKMQEEREFFLAVDARFQEEVWI